MPGFCSTCADTAAVVAQVLQSPGISQLLGGAGGQNAAMQQIIQQAVQAAIGGASPGVGGGGGGRPPLPSGGAGAAPKHLKVFIGGLAQHTTKESLNLYFSQFGQADGLVMMDKGTGRSRGFGFVDFQDPQVVAIVLQSAHQIDGQMVNVSAYGGSSGGSPRAQAAPADVAAQDVGGGGMAGLMAKLQEQMQAGVGALGGARGGNRF